MAASINIEHESGTYTGRVHPHNGYYAGDFWTLRDPSEATGTWKPPTAGIAPLSPRAGS